MTTTLFDRIGAGTCLGRLLILATLLLGGFASAAQASHGGPAWEHDDPARRVYGGGP